ncbi:MAG: DUF1540 domain-containing protein [Solibacillus sp.]
MQTLEVKCTVSDCFFHAKGNICGAEKIEINMNYQADKQQQSEFATDFDAVKEEATQSTQTCCNTFISKKQKQLADNLSHLQKN